MEQNPLAKYGLNRYANGGVGGSRTRGQDGAFQNGNAARDARRAARREQQPMTFAQMQEDGMARPAPSPVASGVQMFAGPTASSESGYELPSDYGTTTPIPGWSGKVDVPYLPPGYYPGTVPNGSVPGYSPVSISPRNIPSGAPSPTDGADKIRKAALDELDAVFAGRKAALNEDLARRGIYASSGELGAGARLGDLEGQYARARAGLESDLIQNERGNEMQLYQLLLQLLPLFTTGGGKR